MRSVRHALSAAAVAAVALGGLTACNGLDIAAFQATAHSATATGDRTSGSPSSPAATGTSAARQASLATTSTPRSTSPVRSSTAPTTAATSTTKPTDTSVAGQLLKLVNAERIKAGCRTVTLDSRLTAAAAGHAKDMAAKDYFSHTSKDGRSFVDRIKAKGYSAPRSENIAAGQPTVAAVMAAWMKSAGHRANILDCSATQMGAASAKGGTYGIYWVQDFGRG